MSNIQCESFSLLLNSSDLNFAMEVHNGLSAKIVEQAGFKAIWASGLSISAALGLRDHNEVSWTHLADTIEHIVNATSIPVLVDGDTGHGNFNNARLLVKKLQQVGAAGVCIEDKVFPKINSFVDDPRQELVSTQEFCGKIKAAKDVSNNNFSIIARTEALIIGAGMKEAINRAEAYRLAGADGIFIHSKSHDSFEIISFAKEWANRSPLIIAPTKYYQTPTKIFRDNNISLILWANQNLRASVKAMQYISKKIFKEESLNNVEDKITTLNELFNILDYDELKKAEEIYLDNKKLGLPTTV